MQKLYKWTQRLHEVLYIKKHEQRGGKILIHSQMALLNYMRRLLVTVLQTDLNLYQILKEKLVYLKKHYKTIFKNVKKGF